jgi:hypothetical protein
MDNRAGKNILIVNASKLLCLTTGIALAASGCLAVAGQSSTLGVGVSVIRSCRVITDGVISSANKASVLSGALPVIQCGKGFTPVVSIKPSQSSVHASGAGVSTQDDLTVTLSF